MEKRGRCYGALMTYFRDLGRWMRTEQQVKAPSAFAHSPMRTVLRLRPLDWQTRLMTASLLGYLRTAHDGSGASQGHASENIGEHRCSVRGAAKDAPQGRQCSRSQQPLLHTHRSRTNQSSATHPQAAYNQSTQTGAAATAGKRTRSA